MKKRRGLSISSPGRIGMAVAPQRERERERRSLLWEEWERESLGGNKTLSLSFSFPGWRCARAADSERGGARGIVVSEKKDRRRAAAAASPP